MGGDIFCKKLVRVGRSWKDWLELEKVGILFKGWKELVKVG